jgi:hypothetical protein
MFLYDLKENYCQRELLSQVCKVGGETSVVVTQVAGSGTLSRTDGD